MACGDEPGDGIEALPSRTAQSPLIRIAIHPPDLQHPTVWRQIRQLVTSIGQGRECVSYEKFVEIFGSAPSRE